ncbi:MAG: endonuclease/exonuclease/phosphatase family protein, partial [Ardenticatenaceae bacterium]|nr:endonuclease/exonuclease/phosphatase family protein [Ardenticatenaceae bacterium]
LIPTIVAALIAAIVLLGLRHTPISQTLPIYNLGLSLLLLLLPLYGFVTTKTAVSTPGSGFPLRIMTYNIHNGFPPYGNLNLEAIAQVIETENPDIIALQEVSRGWVINGSIDTLTWLSQRLNMPYIFNPTADPLWGNALLSRYPIINYELIPLPPDNLPLTRGFIAATIDIGTGQTLNIIATHLHHPFNGSDIRQQQAQVILDYIQNQPHTIITGDFNAEPDSPEAALFHNAGLTDILADIQPNTTFYALGPTRQIDYIWLTPDLTATAIIIPTTPASDHLPIAATLNP